MTATDRPRVRPEAAFPDLEVAPNPCGDRRPERAWLATAAVLRAADGTQHPICPWWPPRRRVVGAGPSAAHARRDAARRAAVIHAYGARLDAALLERCRAVARRADYRPLTPELEPA